MNTQVEAPAGTLHAHVDTEATDCDGRTSRAYVIRFNDAETAEAAQEVNDFSDIHFMERVLSMVASPFAVEQMTVSIDPAGIEVHETTEEGGRWATVWWCTKDCDLTGTSYRDHRAEAAGY